MNSNSVALLSDKRLKPWFVLFVVVLVFFTFSYGAVVQCNSCGSCTSALTTNSVVELNTSVTVPAGGQCINITKSNVIFKCINGAKISGGGTGTGVFIYGVNNATVEDCYIENFSAGIFVDSSNVTLSTNTVENNTIGVQSTSSYISMNNSFVCWNGQDLNSSNWGKSTGQSNSCDEPPGTWRDAPFLNATLFPTPQCTFICLRADVTPPVVSITSPASGTTIDKQPIKVNFTASDDSGQPVVCYALVGGLLASPPVAVDSGSSGTLTVTRYLPIGTPSLNVVCVDKAGNKGYATPITLNVSAGTTCTCDSQLSCSFAMMSGGCVKVSLIKNLTVAGSFVNVSSMPLNVTFDCQGHTVAGDGEGVAFHYADDHLQQLQNCRIVNFSMGILVGHYTNNCAKSTVTKTWTLVNVTNVTVVNSTYDGAYVSCSALRRHAPYSGANHLVAHNLIVNKSANIGVALRGHPLSAAYIYNSQIVNNGANGVSAGTGYVKIVGSRISHNGGNGVGGATGVVIIHSSVLDHNLKNGVYYYSWGWDSTHGVSIQVLDSILSYNGENGLVIAAPAVQNKGIYTLIQSVVVHSSSFSNNGLNGLRMLFIKKSSIWMDNLTATSNGLSGFNITSTVFSATKYYNWLASDNGFIGIYLNNDTYYLPVNGFVSSSNKYGLYLIKTPIKINDSSFCGNTIEDIHTDSDSSLPFLANHWTTRVDNTCDVPYDVATGNFFFDYGYFGCSNMCTTPSPSPPTVSLLYPTAGGTVNYYPIQFKVLVSGPASQYRCGVVLENYPVVADMTVTPGVQATLPYLDRYNFLTAYQPAKVQVMCLDDNGNRGVSAPITFTPIPGTCECYDAQTCSDAVSSNLCKKIIVKNDVDVQGSFVNNSASVINKTFDCQHHLIWGNGTGVAFYIGKGSHNFTLENCAFKNFTNGMVIGDYSHDIHIINTSLTYNRQVALNISMSGLAGPHSYSIYGKNLNLSLNGQYGLFITGSGAGWDVFDNITASKNAWTGVRVEYWSEDVKIINSKFTYNGIINMTKNKTVITYPPYYSFPFPNGQKVVFAPFYPYVVPPTQPGAMDNVGFGLLAQTPMMDQDLAKQSYGYSGYTLYLDHDNASLNMYGFSINIPNKPAVKVYISSTSYVKYWPVEIFNSITTHNLNRGYDLFRYYETGIHPNKGIFINLTSHRDGYRAGEIPLDFTGWDHEGFVFTCTRPTDVIKNLVSTESKIGLLVNNCGEGGCIPTYVNISNSYFCNNGQDVENYITGAFVTTRQYGINDTCTVFSIKNNSYFDDYLMFGCAHTCEPSVYSPAITLIYPKPSTTIDEYPMSFNFTVSGSATRYNCGVMLNNYTVVSDYTTPNNKPVGLLYIDRYNLLNISSTVWNYYKVICYDKNNRGFSTLAKFHAVPGICRCWTPAMCNAAMDSKACTKVILTKDLVTGNSFLSFHPAFKNKVFDCQGHTVIKSPNAKLDRGAGIMIGGGETNSVIENCVLKNYTKGIVVLAGASNFTFRNITILNIQNRTTKSKGQYGILLTVPSIYNITFENIKIINSTDVGIYSNGIGNHYNNIVVEGVATNALIMNDSETVVSNAVLQSNESAAYLLGAALYDQLINVTLANTTQYGVYLWGASRALLKNLRVVNNKWGGIYVAKDSIYNTIENSIIEHNGYIGQFSPTTAGIYINFHANYTTITNNTVMENYGYGIDAQEKVSSMTGNHFCFNSYYDIVAKNSTTIQGGDNNYCLSTLNYKDQSAAAACVYSCGVRHTCSCNSCDTCVQKLNDPLCKRVIVTRDISTTTDPYCLSSLTFASNKILDCRGHTVTGAHYSANFLKLTNVSVINCQFPQEVDLFMADNFLFNNDRFHNKVQAVIVPGMVMENSQFKGVCTWYSSLAGLVIPGYPSPGIRLVNLTFSDYSTAMSLGGDYYHDKIYKLYHISESGVTNMELKNIIMNHSCGSHLLRHRLLNVRRVQNSRFLNLLLYNASYGFTGIVPGNSYITDNWPTDKYFASWADNNTIVNLTVINVTDPVVVGAFVNSKFDNITVKNAKVGLIFFPCNSYYCSRGNDKIFHLHVKNATFGIVAEAHSPRGYITVAPHSSLIQGATLTNITDTAVRVSNVYLNLTNIKGEYAQIGANLTHYAHVFMNKSVFCFNTKQDIIADTTVVSPTQVLSTGVGDYCDHYVNWNDLATVGCTNTCTQFKYGKPFIQIYTPAPDSTVNDDVLNITFEVTGKNLPVLNASSGVLYPITVTVYLNDTPINPLSYRIINGVKTIVGSKFGVHNGSIVSVYVPGVSYIAGHYKLTIVAETAIKISNVTSEVFFWNKANAATGTCYCKSCAGCSEQLENDSCKIVVLQNDLPGLPGTCIKASNVENKTFNLAGWTINDTDQGSGIWLINSQNVTLENGTIEHFMVCINKTNSYNIYTSQLALHCSIPLATSVPIWFVTPPTPPDGATLDNSGIVIKVGLAPSSLKDDVVNYTIFLLNSTGGTIGQYNCNIPSTLPSILYCSDQGGAGLDPQFNNLPTPGVYQFYAEACNSSKKCVKTEVRTVHIKAGATPLGCILTMVLVNRDQQQSYRVTKFVFGDLTINNPRANEYIHPNRNQTVSIGNQMFCQFVGHIGFIHLKMFVYNPSNDQTNIEEGELAITPGG